MHPNPAFRENDRAQYLAFVRDRGFGTLCVNGDDAPLLAHVPFILSPDNTSVDLHLMRSNPIARLLKSPCDAVIAVSGPDSYVSPDWYEAADQVPTWNYIAVHLRGTLNLLAHSELHGLLDRLSEQFETRLAPKPPWTAGKMATGALEKKMRMIVPCRLRIADIQSTWKLAQNKTDHMRRSASRHVASNGIGQETAALAAWMQAPPKG